jgi:lipoprotein NlpI
MLVVVIYCLLLSASAQAPAENPQTVFDQAVADFRAGRIAESAAGFDRLVMLAPASAPQLWQRGIALYYAGRYDDCRAQFESHRTVNPNDVENAAWHFMCVARAASREKAKTALLPVGPDDRVPMREIYKMFKGDLEAGAVLLAAGQQTNAQFYAHLYIGLYSEALGNKARAFDHIRKAADDRYAIGGYMHMVAQVHLSRLQ